MFFNLFSKILIAFKSIYLLSFKINDKPTNNKVIYFNLIHAKFWRTYFNIIYSYLNAGYLVKINLNFKFLAGSDLNSLSLFRQKNISITFNKFKQANYQLCIVDSHNSLSSNASNIIYLNPVKLESPPIHNLSYFMHPFQYTSGLVESIYFLRLNNKRCFKIFFSGNTSQEAYSSNLINKRFGIKNRSEILNIIKSDRLVPLTIDFSNSLDYSLLQNKIVINSWRWSKTESYNLINRVDSDKWLYILSNSSFFICCPGVIMPFSHNAIEAMSVGCIPILEYSHLFTPPLSDNINCISFNGSNLIEILVKIINMDDISIKMMRNEVIKYYDEYLSPKAMVDKINSSIHDSVHFIDETIEWERS